MESGQRRDGANNKEIAAAQDVQVDYEGWLRDHLPGILDNHWPELVFAGLPDDVGSAYVQEVSVISNLLVEDVSGEIEAGPDEDSIVLSFSAKVKVHLDFSYDDYLKFPEVREFMGERDAPFSFSSITMTTSCDVVLWVSVNVTSRAVTSHDLMRIEGNHSCIEMVPWKSYDKVSDDAAEEAMSELTITCQADRSP